MESRLRRKKVYLNEESDIGKKRRREEKERFYVGEKILCYEPDEKLQKVLYDAKISDVFETSKKGSSKKKFEYLVHFLGWNSSWDRRVSEDFLLKDTPSNRELQLKLAEKNSLQLGAYLYRKERKKRMKMNEKKLLLIGSNPDEKSDQNVELEYSSSTTEMSHDDDDRIFFHVGEVLKTHLELDHRMICKEKQVAKIPADRSIIMILESFVKNYTLKILENHFKKRRSVIPNILGRREQNIDYNEIYNDINLAKEAMDGIRVYFNFIIKDFLLYTEEKEHFEKIMSDDFKITFPTHCKERARLDVSFRERKKIIDKMDEEGNEKGNLSSSSSISDPHEVPATKFSSRLNPGLTPEANRLIEETLNWEMIPRLNSPHKEPAMIFGVYHLLRIFIKLPEFLTVSLINEQKMSVLLKYLDSLIEFIEVEELGARKPENYYIDA